MSEDKSIAKMDVRPAKSGAVKRLSFVWFVPVIALAISLAVAYQNYADRGTRIEIAFENASGVTAGETVIKYRDVDVGRVESVVFGEGLADVIVTAEIDKEVAPYLDADAEFWVVEPDVSLRGVSGLSTVLSGVFIEGSWDRQAGEQLYSFRGLDEAPLVTAAQPGSRIVLRARDGSSIADGAPILHKGIQVGFLETPRLAFDGQSVLVNGFVEAPFDQRITTATRFWDTSGFSVNIGANGLNLDVNSLASLIEGGVAFDTVVSGGAPIRNGEEFDIFPDEDTARDSLFAAPTGQTLSVAVLFDSSVSGLVKGSEVRFRGILVGEVADLSAVVVEGPNEARVQLRTVLDLQPDRFGMDADATPDAALAVLSDLVDQGLRARLATGNILSGSLMVELFDEPNPNNERLDTNAIPFPLIPATAPNITDVAQSAEGVLNRINDLPVEELLDSAIAMMDSVEGLASDGALRQVPVDVSALIDDARGYIGSEDVQSIPGDVRAALDGISENANALIGDARALVGSEDVQSIAGDVRGAISNVNTNANGLITDARDLVGSEDVLGVFTDLRDVIADMDKVVDDIAQAQLAAQLSATLENANAVVANLQDASAGLPAIANGIGDLTAKANALELDALIEEATATLNSITALARADSTQAVPANLNVTLENLSALLSEVREGGAVENINATLASASEAAQAVEDSVAGLPALASRANALVAQTEAVIASYSERSRFGTETQATLREIQEAADAVSALARAIQRNPNSLLTGR